MLPIPQDNPFPGPFPSLSYQGWDPQEHDSPTYGPSTASFQLSPAYPPYRVKEVQTAYPAPWALPPLSSPPWRTGSENLLFPPWLPEKVLKTGFFCFLSGRNWQLLTIFPHLHFHHSLYFFSILLSKGLQDILTYSYFRPLRKVRSW